MPFDSSGRFVPIDPFGLWGGWDPFEIIGGTLSRRWDLGSRPTGISGPVYVPPVISEVPQTWEELEQLEPEIFEPILETRPGQIPDPYPQTPDEATVDPVAVIGAPDDWWPTETQEESEEDDMAHDWGHIAREFVSGYIGGNGSAPAGYVGPGPGELVTDPLGIGTGSTSTAGGACDGMRWSGGTPPKRLQSCQLMRCGRTSKSET